MGSALTPAPVPSRRALVAVGVAAAVGFAALLALADSARSPLDDPDPALQRPGLLDIGALPSPSPSLGPARPRSGTRAIVFFERPAGVASLCAALAGSSLEQDADVVVVVSEPASECAASAAVVVDPTTATARRFGLDVPRDGGPPVGYVVIDSAQRIRYRTLDPHVVDGLAEVRTILRATP